MKTKPTSKERRPGEYFAMSIFKCKQTSQRFLLEKVIPNRAPPLQLFKSREMTAACQMCNKPWLRKNKKYWLYRTKMLLRIDQVHNHPEHGKLTQPDEGSNYRIPLMGDDKGSLWVINEKILDWRRAGRADYEIIVRPA